MNRRKHATGVKGAIEIIEEAVHLLRLAPASLLASYYLGSLPFILGLLYFWADMSRGAFAYEHASAAAFGMALVFLWMKCWQSVFARHLHARLVGRPAAEMTFSEVIRLVMSQTFLQATGLFVLPVSALIALPFGWAYGFYQSATVLGGKETLDVRTLWKKAGQQAALWPMQNHVLLFVLSAFGVLVWLNLAIGILLVPWALKTFFAVETMFSRSYWSFFNTTFILAVTGLAYLCLDPILKAAYILRCFYGESRRTGEDLMVEMKTWQAQTNQDALEKLSTAGKQ